MAEKKIVAISREELLFLRKAILKTYNQGIDSPGDKSGYENLTKSVNEKLNIEPQNQKHSPGLFHKLMHDEGHNRDFLDTCYRYISDNQYDRETYLKEIGISSTDEVSQVLVPKTIINWEKRFWNVVFISSFGILLAVFFAFINYYQEKQKTIIWNMTTAWNAESFTHNHYLEYFVNQVKKETNGRLEIRIFPDFQTPNSNGHNKTKEEVRFELSEGTVDILHSGPHINFKENPEAIMFSTIPFGKNYQQMIAWMKKPKIRETLLTLFEKDNILTFQGGHSGPQYGGWYKDKPTDTSFFRNKTVRFANFAGYLLSQPNIGAKQKSMLRYQFKNMFDHINFDVVEWQNPEEDVAMGMHLKGFRYYDKSHWNEPNAMFCFYINKIALENLPKDVRDVLIRVIEKVGEQKIFADETPARQLAENTIENTKMPSCNCNIQIFDLQRDCPQLYQFLYRQNEILLYDFVNKNPQLKWLYDDYRASQ